MTIYTKTLIDGVEYKPIQVTVDKSIDDFNTSSSFSIMFYNDNGIYANTFELNDSVVVYADKDVNPAVTKIFAGIIEDIKFDGREKNERITLSGRDYTAILQDILVSPRIFENMEASDIVGALLIQNANTTGLTFSGIDSTTTTIDRITFNNISLFDAISEVAEIAGYYFYIDTEKDFKFKQKDSVSSNYIFGDL